MTIMDEITTRTQDLLRAESGRVAHNYHPLDVVVATGAGAVLTDVDGTEYLDFLAAYSATNFGHGHPALVAAARDSWTGSPSPPARSTTTSWRASPTAWPGWSARTWCCR